MPLCTVTLMVAKGYGEEILKYCVLGWPGGSAGKGTGVGPDNWNLIPGTHRVEEENQLPQVVH